MNNNKLFTIVLILAFCSCQAQTYKFAVICDTRSNFNLSGTEGVNVSAVKAICNHLKNSGAEFVVALGDFICGNVNWNKLHPPTNHIQLKTFLDAASSVGVSLPGENGEIILYPVRGNHECYHTFLPEDSIKVVWMNNIGYSLPKNGPEEEIGFTYSFQHNGTLFIALDHYMHADSTETKGIKINQEWLDKILQKYHDTKHVFAFGHTPAFAAKQQDCLGEDSLARNRFVRSISERSGVYFCGHDHFYARASIPVYNKTGGIDGYIQQVITPSGAPFNTGEYITKWDGIYNNKNVLTETYIDNAMGYQLVTVTGDRVTVEFMATQDACTFIKNDSGIYQYTYNDNWEDWRFVTMDRFSYTLSEN